MKTFSPALLARLCGALYVFNIGAGIFSESFVREKVYVSGDTAATAQAILGSLDSYRLAFTTDLLAILAAVGSNLLFYELFRVVNKPLNRAALVFGLMSNGLEFVNAHNHYLPILLLGPGQAGLDRDTSQHLAYLALQLHNAGFAVVLEIFSFACLIYGVLIYRSTFLPRFLGALMVIAGACYFTNSFCLFAAPRLQDLLFPYILLPCLLGESTLALWLLIAGVNSERWHLRASVA